MTPYFPRRGLAGAALDSVHSPAPPVDSRRQDTDPDRESQDRAKRC